MLNINKTVENGKAVYTLEGKLDTITSPELMDDVKNVIGGVDELVFDFEKLDYITSAGLRILLAAQKTMDEKDGTLRVLHANDEIMEIFEATGFAAMLTLE
ncbi:MAG: STAS domain-containing protein [Clostridia bacterium]|nr:STAS domain-containing protein [Clostridia bacterium]